MNRSSRRRNEAIENKDQHWIARGYTRAWRDPNTPQGAYVWVMPADGPTAERPAKYSAPKSIFTEADMYTIVGADGARDLTIEHGLGKLEGDFCDVRKKFIEPMKPLGGRERAIVCGFAAATQFRTPTYRDHMRGQWQPILDKMRRLEARHKADADQGVSRKWRPPPLSSVGSDRPGMSMADVEAIVNTPLQATMPPLVRMTTPELLKMTFTILHTKRTPGFITSDQPCVWFDPEAVKRPRLFQRVGLMWPSLQITLPISPTKMLILTRQDWPEYFDIDEGDAPGVLVDELNRLTCRHAEALIVVNRNEYRAHWAEWGELPQDAWEKRHGAAE